MVRLFDDKHPGTARSGPEPGWWVPPQELAEHGGGVEDRVLSSRRVVDAG